MVFGPRGRPDIALFNLAASMQAGQPIDVYVRGKMQRDFTYVDDLADASTRLIAVRSVLGSPVEDDSLSAVAPFRTVNIACGRRTELMAFIEAIEKAMGKQAKSNMLPMQPGDVVATWWRRGLRAMVGSVAEAPVEEGVARFVEWYRSYCRSTDVQPQFRDQRLRALAAELEEQAARREAMASCRRTDRRGRTLLVLLPKRLCAAAVRVWQAAW